MLFCRSELTSWAVPKGSPEKPSMKRLAIQVEHHELLFRQFEGNLSAIAPIGRASSHTPHSGTC
jgi:hypothetical protein